jgi:predicted TIM-barrel fold metal-dependent hydrolase
MSNPHNTRYVVISTDGHCGADLWDYKPYLENRFHDDFDTWASTYVDAWGELDQAQDRERFGVASFADPVNWTSDLRNQRLLEQGIVAEVLFPNTAPPFYPSGAITAPGPRTTQEYEYRIAGTRAHNRWLAEFCAAAHPQRAGIAQVFIDDVDDAIADVEWARANGLRGVLLPGDHLAKLANLYYPHLDRLWATCAELDMPVHRHGIAVAEPPSPQAGPAATAIGLLESYFFAQRPLAHMILAGVFDRHPRLKFVMTEIGVAWAVPYLANLDGYYDAAALPGTIPNLFSPQLTDVMRRRPSEYFRSNCYIGSFFTEADVASRHEVGVDRLMWGADFPHHEGTTPYSREAIRANFATLPEPEVRRMLALNAAECYGFDLDALQTIADEVGPTAVDLHRPLTDAETPSFPTQTACPTFMPAA